MFFNSTHYFIDKNHSFTSFLCDFIMISYNLISPLLLFFLLFYFRNYLLKMMHGFIFEGTDPDSELVWYWANNRGRNPSPSRRLIIWNWFRVHILLDGDLRTRVDAWEPFYKECFPDFALDNKGFCRPILWKFQKITLDPCWRPSTTS